MRCERLSRRNYSLHSEGRAIDWHLDAHDRSDRRVARKLIALLLASDRLGNRHAFAGRHRRQPKVLAPAGSRAGEIE